MFLKLGFGALLFVAIIVAVIVWLVKSIRRKKQKFQMVESRSLLRSHDQEH
jgi:hypothetical protein